MTVLIGTWEFEGPFEVREHLREEPAIYAILSSVEDDVELVELNETENVHQQFLRLQEVTPADRQVSIAVYYCSDLTDGLREGLVDIILREFELSEDFDPARVSHSQPISEKLLIAVD
jgi:hypothetical protein